MDNLGKQTQQNIKYFFNKLFNGGWAILETLDPLITWSIHWLIKMRDNSQVFLENAHPAFLTT